MKSSRVLIAGALGASLVGCSSAQIKPDRLALGTQGRSPKPVLPPAPAPAQTNAAVASAPEKPADPFAAGVAALDAGKLDEAAADFRAALERDPKNVRAQHDLGVIAWRKNDVAAAEEAYRAALKIDPTFAPSLVQLGKLYRATNRVDAEVALLEKASATPTFAHEPTVLNELATAYRQKKDFAKAEATCRSVLARSKDDVDALQTLARIYFDQGNDRLAGFVAAKAARLAPKNAGIHNDLGMIALRLGETPVALAEFQKAVELDPTFEPGYLNLGAIALRYRDYQNAEKAFAKASALAPNDAQAHLAQAWALDGERAQDPSKAALAGAEYEKVIALQPASSEAVCGAGWAYAADKTGWEKAKSFLERCKASSETAAEEKQRIDAKLQSIAMLEKSQPAHDASTAGVGGSGAVPKATGPGAQPAAPGATPAAGGSAPTAPGAQGSPAVPAAAPGVASSGTSPALAGESAAPKEPPIREQGASAAAAPAAPAADPAATSAPGADGAQVAPAGGAAASSSGQSAQPAPDLAVEEAVQQPASTAVPKAGVTPAMAPAGVDQVTSEAPASAAAGPNSAPPHPEVAGSVGTAPSSKP